MAEEPRAHGFRPNEAWDQSLEERAEDVSREMSHDEPVGSCQVLVKSHVSECKWKLVLDLSWVMLVSLEGIYIYVWRLLFQFHSCRMLFEWCGLHLRYLECIMLTRLMFCEFKAIGFAALCAASTVWCFFVCEMFLRHWWSLDRQSHKPSRTHASGGVSEGAPFGFLSHGVGSQFMALVAYRLKQEPRWYGFFFGKKRGQKGAKKR